MSRELAYDLTHLMHRAAFAAPSGIEKVDLTFAKYLGQERRQCLGVHYGYGAPIVMNSSSITSAVERVQNRWKEELRSEADAQFSELRDWLIKGRDQTPGNAAETHPQKLNAAIRSLSRRTFLPFSSGKCGKIPEGAIYLNIAQHALETSIYFRWMLHRRDVHKVFFIHDLLPVDHPEFWAAQHLKRFERRIACAVDNGTAFITSSEAVARRLRLKLIERGRAQTPILSCCLPPPNKFLDREMHEDRELQGVPYFVAIGTLEPRKNYAFLLHIWNELSSKSLTPPKLVIVGKNGWASEEIVGLIRRCKTLRGCVNRVTGLASASLKRLVVNSRAVLFPSFAEGFGLPIVEALSAGVPVVASDSDVVREVSQGCANYQNPLDGCGWISVVEDLSRVESSLNAELRGLAQSFVPMTTDKYFRNIEQFLDSLPT